MGDPNPGPSAWVAGTPLTVLSPQPCASPLQIGFIGLVSNKESARIFLGISKHSRKKSLERLSLLFFGHHRGSSSPSQPPGWPRPPCTLLSLLGGPSLWLPISGHLALEGTPPLLSCPAFHCLLLCCALFLSLASCTLGTDYKFYQTLVTPESDSSLIRGPDSLYLSQAN